MMTVADLLMQLLLIVLAVLLLPVIFVLGLLTFLFFLAVIVILSAFVGIVYLISLGYDLMKSGLRWLRKKLFAGSVEGTLPKKR